MYDPVGRVGSVNVLKIRIGRIFAGSLYFPCQSMQGWAKLIVKLTV